HAERKLVVTNQHVVRSHPVVAILFPAYDDKKKLITNVGYYVQNAKMLGIRATVVQTAASKDLAVLQIDRFPDEARPVPFARQPAAAGAKVWSIGASGVRPDDATGQLWRLSDGTVRSRYEDTITLRGGQKVKAMLLETTAGVNPGDSGGPVVNDLAELVAVV